MAEATYLRNNALPYPIYGAPWTVVFPILDADGDLVTGASSPDSEVSKNGDGFADCTNEATEIATSSGMYYLSLTGTELTTDVAGVIVKCGTAGAKTTPIVLYPRKLVTVRSGTSAGGDTGYITLDGSASAMDDYYNGMVCVATIDSNVECRVITDYTGSNKQATVTPAWNVAPDADDTFIVYLPEGVQMPTVNVTHILGVAVSTTTAQVGVNVVQLSGDGTAADNAESFFDGTGYAGTNNVMPTTTTVTNAVTANMTQISGSSTAADNLEASALGVVTGTAVTGTLTTTAFTTNLTEVTDNHYNNRVCVFTSGVLAGQAKAVTDYDGASKTLTTRAFTEAPSNADAFVLV